MRIGTSAVWESSKAPWNAHLSFIPPPPIGLKPLPNERPGAMNHSVLKDLSASFSSYGPLKVVLFECLTPNN